VGTDTLYLTPETTTPAMGVINNSGGYEAGATSIVVETTQGEFPSPGAGQAFTIVIDGPGAGPGIPWPPWVTDNTPTERCIVTANSSGTFTIPAGLANNHADGAGVRFEADSDRRRRVSCRADAAGDAPSGKEGGCGEAPGEEPIQVEGQLHRASAGPHLRVGAFARQGFLAMQRSWSR
jgi:hypothetical protein